ncbi:MAG: HEAT repeat domain-containing protein [Gemmatimonadales bacterium]|nr:HEAT repeat domain-containing protein [Gemmatimonadales bacterium]
MDDELKLAVLFGRLLELIRSQPDATYEMEASLGGLLELSGRRSLSLRLAGGQVYVDGVPILPDTPFAALIVQQLAAHGLAAVVLPFGAPALDVLHAAWAIALDPTNYPIGSSAGGRLRALEVHSISFVSAEVGKAVAGRRAVPVGDAVGRLGTFAVESGHDAHVGRTVAGAREGTAFEDIVSHPRESLGRMSSLAAMVERLRGEAKGPKLMGGLDTFQRALEKALDQDQLPPVVDAMLVLIRAEAQAESEDGRRAFGIALRRALTSDVLRRLVPLLLDELYAADVLTILRRAGADGTRVMVHHLVNAPTFAERKTYLKALREIQEGSDVIAALLSHSEWYVVRNAADLVADLRILEAVPLLGRVTEHEDERVRLSVALALAKIGTPDSVRFLRAPLRDPVREVRLAVARELRGKGLGALSMVLLHAAESEEDPEVVAEYYRALGRIGTTEAVQALVEVAQPGQGLFSSGKTPSHRRVAATEGLALAASDVARTALQDLARDRDRDVRAAAAAGL